MCEPYGGVTTIAKLVDDPIAIVNDLIRGDGMIASWLIRLQILGPINPFILNTGGRRHAESSKGATAERTV
jgi:hypothetical protein